MGMRMIWRGALPLVASLLCAGGAAGHVRLAAPAAGAATRYVTALLGLPHLPPAARPVVGARGAFDVALLDPAALAGRCADGSLAHLDWARLGGRERFVPEAASDCGAGAYVGSLVLAWHGGKSAPPLGWADLWNVARMPGRRALPETPVGTLEIALLADGVAAGDVYGALSREDGVARAFRKLDQLRPYIVWWHDDGEALRILASGGARMAAAPADRVVLARPSGAFGWQPAGAVATVESFAVAKAAAPAAYAMIAAATDAGREAAIARATGLGVTVGQGAPLAPGLWSDGGFWHAHGAALRLRFAGWMARK